MTKSAMELLNERDKRNSKFSIGEVFATSFSKAFYDFPIFFLIIMAAGLLVFVTNLTLPIMRVAIAWSDNGQAGRDVYWYYSIFISFAVFITEAFFYPIAALFITRRILIRLKTVQLPAKLELQWRHFFLAIGIGVLLTVIHFMCYGLFSRIAIAIQDHTSNISFYGLRILFILSNGLSSFIVISILSFAFILLVPVSISENIEFSSLFQRTNAIAAGKRVQIFLIMLLSSAIIWVLLKIVLGLGLNVILPNIMLRYGIVGIIQFPFQGFLYAYMFMLPAVIYHHLRLEELSRENE